jgi:hypothetical protein
LEIGHQSMLHGVGDELFEHELFELSDLENIYIGLAVAITFPSLP